LPGADPHQRRVTVCKLVEKAYRQGHGVYLRTSSPEETRVLDDLLWTFRQGSFVAHDVCADPNAPVEAPVLIGHSAAPEAMADVLVNLAPDVPPGFERFERVAEFVDQDESVKLAGRVRYKAYKDAGYTPETHKLDGRA
jgi:DNA polymerase-3 subunit chi